MKKRKTVEIEKPTLSESVRTFLQNARLDLINAVCSSCRRRFPKTVEVLDGLSQAETEAVKNGGLLSLPQSKVARLENAMLDDGFMWA